MSPFASLFDALRHLPLAPPSSKRDSPPCHGSGRSCNPAAVGIFFAFFHRATLKDASIFVMKGFAQGDNNIPACVTVDRPFLLTRPDYSHPLEFFSCISQSEMCLVYPQRQEAATKQLEVWFWVRGCALTMTLTTI